MSLSNVTAQGALIRGTCKLAGITDLGATAMVECYGTGDQDS